MRYQSSTNKPYLNSKYSGLYTQLARWSNQPQFVKKISFREFCIKNQEGKSKTCSALAALNLFEKDHPEVAARYFDLRF